MITEKVMKKEKLIRIITDNVENIHQALDKITDCCANLEDEELCELLESWCSGISDALDEADVENLIESVEELYSIQEDE